MSPIDVKQSHAFEMMRLNQRLRRGRGCENDLPRTIPLPHQHHRVCSLRAVQQHTRMPMRSQHCQSRRYRTTAIFRIGGGLRHTLMRIKLRHHEKRILCLCTDA